MSRIGKKPVPVPAGVKVQIADRTITVEGKLGQQIGSQVVTVKDDPSMMQNGYYPFDDEGSVSQETVLVKEGILNSYLHSRETAGRMGGVPRNARAQGIDRPVVRMSNTYIANGDRKVEEIFE